MDLLSKDNIIAEITPVGRGGVSAIRISGPNAKSITSSFLGKDINKERHAYYVQHEIDDLVVVYYKAPDSYTGEDVCELFCHGNPALVDDLINSMIKNSGYQVRTACNGEFTKRAYLNGKIDLVQAEAVVDIINASSVSMIAQKRRLLKGELSQKLNEIKDGLLELASLYEANIDFSDDDLGLFDEGVVKHRLAGLERISQDLLSSAVLVNDVSDTLKIVIVGLPNVGKSSLFNRLVEYERSIVHHLPGTTRDYIEEDIIVDGTEVSFVDTAGFRELTDSDVEKEGIRRINDLLKTASIVIEVSDDGNFSIDLQNVVRVLNKADLVNDVKVKKGVCLVSAKTGLGIIELKKIIFDMIRQKNKMNSQKEGAFTINSRQIKYLNDINKSIQNIKNGLANKEPLDLMSFLLRESLFVLNNVLGSESVNEDILNDLFSRFCIGK